MVQFLSLPSVGYGISSSTMGNFLPFLNKLFKYIKNHFENIFASSSGFFAKFSSANLTEIRVLIKAFFSFQNEKIWNARIYFSFQEANFILIQIKMTSFKGQENWVINFG